VTEAADVTKPWTVWTFETVEGWVFRHDADTALHQLCSDFNSGKLSEDQARNALERFTDFIELGDFEDVDVDTGFGFPFICDDPEYVPATDAFAAWAVRQTIPGVHWLVPDWRQSSVMTGEGYLVADDADALARLCEQAKGTYEIVRGTW
jgi:hypothetical protein